MVSKISAAKGDKKAQLVFKNGFVVNVFTDEIEQADVAVTDGIIVGIGDYQGENEIDCSNKYIVPGFIDGHIHLESSMMRPVEFAKAVLPHGTTSVITDPHEITNVCGKAGIRFMMEETKDLPLDVYFALPSCVPAAPLDEAGATLNAADLHEFYESKRVVALAEVMNYVGVLAEDQQVLDKLKDAKANHRVIDGHAPGLTGSSLNAYITAGVESDHECSTAAEAKEKISRGQWLMIRQGTAAKNLEQLLPMFLPPYCYRSMLVTDDKHPGELKADGHIDSIIRQAVALGADPCLAIRMATLNAATFFGLHKVGAVAPAYHADLVVLTDLKECQVEQVYKDGCLVAEHNEAKPIAVPTISEELKKEIYQSFHMKKLEAKDFLTTGNGNNLRVMELTPHEILTKELIVPYIKETDGVDLPNDIIKLAVIERHKETGHMGLGFLKGYGLKKGAIASSVAHDSHNLIIAGTNENDMLMAANCVNDQQGGWVVVADGKVLASLPLPIAGLMCESSAEDLEKEICDMKQLASELGVASDIDAYMTLAFLSLPVLPELKLTTSGLVNVQNQELLQTRF